MKVYTYLCYLFFIGLISCNGAAKDTEQAKEILLGAKVWNIEEIQVNDAPVFEDGKKVQQFGGIEFERYMESVSFKPNGEFVGKFVNKTTPMNLYWGPREKDITVGDKDGKGGVWTILPADVSEQSFVMRTQSNAYDYPRMTKVSLKFKSAQ